MINRGSIILKSSLFIVFLCIYVLIASGHYGGDAINNYLVTKSLAERGSLSISKDMLDIEDLKIDAVGTPGRDGQLFSHFGLGMPLLQMPFYLLGLLISLLVPKLSGSYITFFTVSFTNTVISAVNALLIFCIATAMGSNRRRAAALSFIYGISTMAIVYAKVGFIEPAMVMFMLISFYLLVLNRGTASGRGVFLSGLCFGLMFFTRIHSIILLPSFILYLSTISKRRWRDLAMFLIGPAAFLAVVLSLNYYQFGAVFATGYGAGPYVNTNTGGIASIIRLICQGGRALKALYYYLLSTGKGIFLYNPVIILSVFCIRAFWKQHRDEAIFILTALAIQLVFFSSMFIRGSIFSWGPRYIFPAVPLMVIMLIGCLDSPVKRLSAFFLAVIGLLIQIPALLVNYSRYIFFVKDRLGLDEYMINFIPDLSPIKGTWLLLLSAISRITGGAAGDFIYTPDERLVAPLTASFQGYDFFDLWFINIIRFDPGYHMIVKVALAFICMVLIGASLSLASNIIRGQDSGI